MSKNLLKKFIFLFGLLIISGSVCGVEVTYLSHETAYINAGSDLGLQLGDTLKVFHGDSLRAVIVVSNISSTSSACAIIETFGEIRAGDVVEVTLSHPIEKKQMEIRESGKTETVISKTANRLDGYISVQNYYQRDMTGSSLSYIQPSVVSKVKIEQFAGKDLTLSIKHRSRLTHRSRSLSTSMEKDQWYHRVYEVALESNKKSSWNWRLGRQAVYEVRGIGFIDGLLIERNLTARTKIGVAGGFEPDRLTTDISFDRKKVGLYVGWENDPLSAHVFRFSGGVAGSYIDANINREFFAFSSTYRYTRLFSLNVSSEVDVNRNWRKERSGSSLALSNVYLNARYNPWESLSLYTSYDRRENYFDYTYRYTADSLFDDDVFENWRVGTTIKVSSDIRFNGYGGIRFREGIAENNRFASGSLLYNRFPQPGQAVTIRMAYVHSEFTTGYRPSISYRFPFTRKIKMNVTGSAYHYSGQSMSMTQYYLDLAANYYSTSAYFLSGSYRQYFEKENRSGQLFLELGWYL